VNQPPTGPGDLQPVDTSPIGQPPDVDTNWYGIPLDGVSTEWTRTVPVPNPVTREWELSTNRYVEVSSGLNYIDYSDSPSGVWVPAVDAFCLLTNGMGGAAALRGQTKMYVSPTLGGGTDSPAVTLVTASNTKVTVSPMALYYRDVDSGESVLIAPVRDAEGEWIPPNTVVYRSAFDNLNADIRITYTHGVCESDVILRERIASPASYNLHGSNVRLELAHLLGGTVPRLTSQQIDTNLVDETSATMAAR
jgi:hypothetical protein